MAAIELRFAGGISVLLGLATAVAQVRPAVLSLAFPQRALTSSISAIRLVMLMHLCTDTFAPKRQAWAELHRQSQSFVETAIFPKAHKEDVGPLAPATAST